VAIKAAKIKTNINFRKLECQQLFKTQRIILNLPFFMSEIKKTELTLNNRLTTLS
jgi:hypothetical protein